MEYKAKYRLVVDLPFLSDENPKFKQMVEEFIEIVRTQNHIPSYATSSDKGSVRIEEIPN